MLILQRMAMATSSSFLSIPLLKTSSLLYPVKHCASPLSSEFRALSLYGGRNGVSTSSAMATEAQVSTQDDKLKDAQMEAADKPEKVVLPTNESSESLIKIRDTCAHVMAMAVQKLFPDAKVTIGPWIENGFYYDFDMEPLTDKELKRIKKEMDRIIGRNLPLIREEVSRDEGHKRITALNEPYKLEILDSIKEDPITIYHIVAVLGAVYRYELSGSLHGLFRVRGFTQDDAHIFCLEDQIKDEIRGVLHLTEELLLQFGFSKYEVNHSTRPEKAVGDDDIWVKP
ncbi:hypothetical protein PS1_036513 [Malus domestica]